MKLYQDLCIVCLGGSLYVGMEFLWRGHSHWTMFLVGGLCFFLIGNLNTWNPGLPLLLQALLGCGLITLLELISGTVCNLMLGMAVWDYSALPFNFRGQICLYYGLAWIPVSLTAVFVEDLARKWMFAVPLPPYRWL